jgi:broad specificity phosphatase PhoE
MRSMPRSILQLLLFTCALALAACSTTPRIAAGNAEAVTFIVVRHAEKATDDARDPSLSDAGRTRATALAALLQRRDIVAAYATDFRRTQATASPTASAHGIAVATYDADEPAAAFAGRLRRDHATGSVLVVGHSNTVPGIVSALCACHVAPIDDSDYGNLYEVRIDGTGTPVLARQRY